MSQVQLLKDASQALVAVAQLIGHRPRHQKVAASIPRQEAAHRCFTLTSMFPSLSPSPSL